MNANYFGCVYQHECLQSASERCHLVPVNSALRNEVVSYFLFVGFHQSTLAQDKTSTFGSCSWVESRSGIKQVARVLTETVASGASFKKIPKYQTDYSKKEVMTVTLSAILQYNSLQARSHGERDSIWWCWDDLLWCDMELYINSVCRVCDKTKSHKMWELDFRMCCESKNHT